MANFPSAVFCTAIVTYLAALFVCWCPCVDQVVQKTPTSLDNFFVMCNSDEKLSQLVQFLKTHPNDKVIVFFMTCACVDFFVKALPLCGVPAESVMGLHGRMQQKKRVSTHHKFKQVHMGCSAPPRSPFAHLFAPC